MSKEIATYRDLADMDGISLPSSVSDLSFCPSKSEIEAVLASGHQLQLSDIYADNELVAIDDIEITLPYPTILTNLEGSPGATIAVGACHSTSAFSGTTTEDWQLFYNNSSKDSIRFESQDKFIVSVKDVQQWFIDSEGYTYFLVVRADSRYLLYSFQISYSVGSRLNDPEVYGYDHQEQIRSTFVKELTYIDA